MRRTALSVMAAALLAVAGLSACALAQEHPGEHPGRVAKSGEQVTPEMIRSGIKAFIEKDSALKGGYFLLYDRELKKTWTLEFVKVHDRVSVIKGKTYFACCDFRAVGEGGKGRVLDIDIWMEKGASGFEPVDVKIHKIDGKPRYVYDKDEIVPLE